MASYHFSAKFYLGILFVALSLIIGKITTFTFFWYMNDNIIRWFSIIIYILSWPLLVWGIIWIGKEYTTTVRKYISYQFYHESITRGTRKAFYKTKEIGHAVRQKVRNKLDKMPKMPKISKIHLDKITLKKQINQTTKNDIKK